MAERWGPYEILEELGRGGMGVVYKAHDHDLARTVAIKVLGEQFAGNRKLLERFVREARGAASLNHPHIIQVYFIGNQEGTPYFVMEYVAGETLAQTIQRERSIPPKRAAEILLEAASGLAAAHGAGIVHRDIKPANIMIAENGVVKVADFGIARVPDPERKLTETGQFLGTPGYFAPEVLMGEPADFRSDIFSLGIVYFEMLTGRIPFDAESPYALMQQVVDANIPDVTKINGTVDRTSRDMVQRMVRRQPGERYADCDLLIADLKTYLSGGAQSEAVTQGDKDPEPDSFESLPSNDLMGMHPPTDPLTPECRDSEATLPNYDIEDRFLSGTGPRKVVFWTAIAATLLLAAAIVLYGTAGFTLDIAAYGANGKDGSVPHSAGNGAGISQSEEYSRNHSAANGSVASDSVRTGLSRAGDSGDPGFGLRDQASLDAVIQPWEGGGPVAGAAAADGVAEQREVSIPADKVVTDREEGLPLNGNTPHAGQVPDDTVHADSVVTDLSADDPAARADMVIADVEGSGNRSPGPSIAAATSENEVGSVPAGAASLNRSALARVSFDFQNPGVAVFGLGDPLLARDLESNLEKLLRRDRRRVLDGETMGGPFVRSEPVEPPEPSRIVRAAHRGGADVVVLAEVIDIGDRDVAIPGAREAVRISQIRIDAILAATGRKLNLRCFKNVSYTPLNATEIARETAHEFRHRIREALAPDHLEAVGTGKGFADKPTVVIVAEGNALLAHPLANLAARRLEKKHYTVLDPAVDERMERDWGDWCKAVRQQGGDLLLHIAVEDLAQREVEVGGQYALAHTARIDLRCFETGKGRKLGPGWDFKLEYTSLNAQDQVEERGRRIMRDLIKNIEAER